MSTEEQQIVTEEAPRAEKRSHKEIDENDEVVAAKTKKIEKDDKAENEVEEEEEEGEEEEAGDNEESSTVTMTRDLIAFLAIVALASAQATAKPAAAATPKPAAPAPKPAVAAPKPAAPAAAAGAIKCVQCQSTKKGEENCAESGDHLAKYTKPCNPLNEGAYKGNKAVGCRKIHQNVGDDKGILRECAYSGEDIDGQRRTGNSGIILFYYQCSDNEGQPCNGVSSVSLFASLLVLFSLRFLA
ncbi:hypothetical protein PMAYCL1PPCAC_02674 [Pristionchus mayeri]|uniref:Uncharacterized protein n=1 Tax=Pristionchus mayeri TaxID=1317129 RepID=A0AAN5C860_9BILA|nr:hypothetical protein PMAYCL1PPCAC_02674 [Pristionchus mayeri]